MADATHSSHQHRHDHHDWDSPKYVSNWAAGRESFAPVRRMVPAELSLFGPYDKKLPIRILDVGAGYGAVTQFLLSHFSNAGLQRQAGLRFSRSVAMA